MYTLFYSTFIVIIERSIYKMSNLNFLCCNLIQNSWHINQLFFIIKLMKKWIHRINCIKMGLLDQMFYVSHFQLLDLWRKSMFPIQEKLRAKEWELCGASGSSVCSVLFAWLTTEKWQKQIARSNISLPIRNDWFKYSVWRRSDLVYPNTIHMIGNAISNCAVHYISSNA